MLGLKPITKLCKPAILYLVMSAVVILLMAFAVPFGITVVNALVALVWAYCLAYLCDKNLAGVSWFLVLWPLILVFVCLLYAMGSMVSFYGGNAEQPTTSEETFIGGGEFEGLTDKDAEEYDNMDGGIGSPPDGQTDTFESVENMGGSDAHDDMMIGGTPDDVIDSFAGIGGGEYSMEGFAGMYGGEDMLEGFVEGAATTGSGKSKGTGAALEKTMAAASAALSKANQAVAGSPTQASGNDIPSSKKQQATKK